MYYVYILVSEKENFRYIGFSSDLKKRFAYHQKGWNQTTKKHLPVKLAYYEAYLSEKDARKRERFLKSGRGRELIQSQAKFSLRE